VGAADWCVAIVFLSVLGALALAVGRALRRMMGLDGPRNPKLKNVPNPRRKPRSRR
jgi:hypothetical protein